MPATTIRLVRNRTPLEFTIQNLENPADTEDHGVRLPPHSDWECTMWLPGTESSEELRASRRIALFTVVDGILMAVSVWETNARIRFAKVADAQGPRAVSDGQFIDGNAAEGGDRTLELRGDSWSGLVVALY